MNAERIQLLIIKDEIDKLPPVDKVKVQSIANQITSILDANPEHAMLALAWVGAEKAAE
jgi:hypothetical protein